MPIAPTITITKIAHFLPEIYFINWSFEGKTAREAPRAVRLLNFLFQSVKFRCAEEFSKGDPQAIT